MIEWVYIMFGDAAGLQNLKNLLRIGLTSSKYSGKPL